MNKQRKTSNILNVFQYDEVTGAVTLPSTLVLTAPDGSDNSTKVPTTAWTRSYVSGLSYLTGNQSITVSGDATGSGTTSINLTLANTAVTPGTYGSTTLVPVVTVDSKGRITNVTTAAISGSLSFTGDVTGTGTTGTSTGLTLANSGVTAGTYTKVTVDSKGRVTVGASATTTDIAEGTRLYYTDARVLAYLGANNYATQSYVTTQIANLVASAPATLDTLNELAAALGNDASFATTTATSLGNRLRVDTAAQGLNGTQQSNGRTNLGLGTAATSAIGDFATAAQGTRADTAHGWGNHASAGYLTSATAATTYASLTGSYANPSWITSLAYSKITGVPAFLTSYTETDTLANVTSRGASTSTAVTFSGGASISNLLINGAPAVTESSLALGAMGATEGGQLTLNRATSHTFAAHLDVWQDTFRILYGTNTATSGVAMGINMSTGRVNLPFYTTSSSFTGTAAGVLAFDSSGNIITIAVPGGAVSSVNAGTGISVNATIGAVTVTNTGTLTVAGTANQVLVNGGSAAANGNITLSLPQNIHTSASPTFDQVITGNNGNGTNFRIGDDAWIGDINLSNTFRVQGVQNAANAYIVFGNGDTTALGRAGTGALTYGGNIIYHAGNIPTWNQNTTGSAGSVAWTGVTGRPTALSSFTNDLGNYGGWITSSTADSTYIKGTTNPGSVGNFTLSIGNNGTYSYVQSHSSQPLELNPVGNAVRIAGNIVWHQGNLTNLNQLSNGPGYITGYTETDTLASVTGRGASTSTISNFNGGLTSAKTSKNTYAIQIKGAFYGAPRLQLYDLAVDGNAYVGLGVDMSGGAYEFSNYFPRYGGNGRWSVGSWAGDFGSGQYVSGYNEKLWLTESAAAFNVPLTVNGVLYFTDTTNGFYKSGGRLTARSESTDNVANFANYGLYLPKTGETAGLYVESPIEARGGIRMGSGAANGSITVGADTGAGANRLVQRDAGGDTYVRYSFAVHFNQTGGNSENPTIGQIWTQSTTDNYVRKSTPAHFISQLGLITTSNYSSYSLPLSGGVMTGALVNNTDGAVIMESNASENNNWLWKEASKTWGLFWFNRGTQSGQTIGGYTTVGAELMFMGGSSGIAMPSAWTGYIAGSNIAAMISNWNGYIYSASTVFAATSMVVGGNTVLHAGNFSSYSVPVRGMSNWNDSTVLDDVIGMLAWKNYGNNHVIFDASQSTAPNGTSVNNTNSQVAWTGTYPTLMGWNGSNTYGVRVDSARVADSASNSSTVGGLSADTFYRNLGFGSGFPSWDLNSVAADRSGFTYSNNAPWTGPFLHIGASGYGMQFNASYGDGSGLSYRVRNGDNATWGSWRRLVWEGGTWSFNISGNAGSVNGRSVGNAAGNIGYFDSNGNLYVNNPESYGGEVRLGAAWGRGGVYASSTLSLSTSSSNIHFVFGNSVPISMDSNGTINIGGSTNAPLSITGGAHKYLTINPGNGWEAMVRYIGGSGSGWYVGKRTSGQLVGTQSFHFYSEEAGATVGGITPSGVLHTTGGATLNGQLTISRHIDANTAWGSCTSIFLGWGGGKVILGNSANGGHDYALNLGCNTVVSTNPFFCHQDITAFSDARVKENVEVLENAIYKVKAIRGVTFTRNDTDDTNKRHVGVIAQEVLAVLPEAVSEDDRGHYSVAYGNMSALLIEAIKEQQKQIEELQKKLESLIQN